MTMMGVSGYEQNVRKMLGRLLVMLGGMVDVLVRCPRHVRNVRVTLDVLGTYYKCHRLFKRC